MWNPMLAWHLWTELDLRAFLQICKIKGLNRKRKRMTKLPKKSKKDRSANRNEQWTDLQIKIKFGLNCKKLK